MVSTAYLLPLVKTVASGTKKREKVVLLFRKLLYLQLN